MVVSNLEEGPVWPEHIANIIGILFYSALDKHGVGSLSNIKKITDNIHVYNEVQSKIAGRIPAMGNGKDFDKYFQALLTDFHKKYPNGPSASRAWGMRYEQGSVEIYNPHNKPLQEEPESTNVRNYGSVGHSMDKMYGPQY